MASISTLTGVQDSPLVGQVTERTRPEQDLPVPASPTPRSGQPQPVGQPDPREGTDNDPNQRVSATLEETQEVASKLQEKIDEAAWDHHLVSIVTDEETQTSVIQIKDPEGEVIKQYPPEKVLNLHEKLDDLSGMVIDEMI